MLWLSKHYYNGSQRIASQTGTPSWLPSGTIFEQGAGSEKKQYHCSRKGLTNPIDQIKGTFF